jgi:tRNA uridine 5-carboxymethylaminomethyl modification enzyme
VDDERWAFHCEKQAAIAAGAVPDGADERLTEQVQLSLAVNAKYAGYLARQELDIARLARHETTVVPDSLDYRAVAGLSSEVRERLLAVRPATLGQAARIPGLTPAAISLLLVHLKKLGIPA